LGCCTTNAQCTDGSSCTDDVCDPATHTCTNTLRDGCCLVDEHCDDGNVCTREWCDTAVQACSVTVIEDCCNEAADCDDSDPCTDDVCPTPGGLCLHTDNGTCCAGTDCDAGVVDAGPTLPADSGPLTLPDAGSAGPVEEEGGCACRLEGRGGAPVSPLWLLAGFLWLVRRRRLGRR
jgi:hypothetical protein